MKKESFPRKLFESERMLLFSLLPDNKSGYKNYRSIIDEYFVIGEGRLGNGNLILGGFEDLPDFSISSSAVFALGNVVTDYTNYYVVIHSVNEGMLEVQIDPYPVKEEIVVEKVFGYSDWEPGMRSPENNSEVHQYLIKDNEYLLAICPVSKKIWLHEFITGINFIIPKSNFVNELMRIQKVSGDRSLINQANFFNNLNKFSDEEIKLAFLLYNKYLKHFDLGSALDDLLAKNDKRKRSFKLFGRGLN